MQFELFGWFSWKSSLKKRFVLSENRLLSCIFLRSLKRQFLCLWKQEELMFPCYYGFWSQNAEENSSFCSQHDLNFWGDLGRFGSSEEVFTEMNHWLCEESNLKSRGLNVCGFDRCAVIMTINLEDVLFNIMWFIISLCVQDGIVNFFWMSKGWLFCFISLFTISSV